MDASALDPDQLRAFVRRDWGCLDRLDLVARAAQPVEQKIQLAIALYEAAKATVPGWPSASDRMADLAHHIAVRAILRKAAHVRLS